MYIICPYTLNIRYLYSVLLSNRNQDSHLSCMPFTVIAEFRFGTLPIYNCRDFMFMFTMLTRIIVIPETAYICSCVWNKGDSIAIITL